MSSLNKVTLIGRLGKDPEIKNLNSGDKVANFSMAMSETWKDKQTGERKEKTEWANVAVFGDGIVGVIDKYVSKGSLIYIEGQLKTRTYEKNGETRYVTEVVLSGMNGKLVLLSGKADSERSDGGGGSRQQSRSSQMEERDDEIPF